MQQRAAACVTTAIQKLGDLPISIGSIQVRHFNKIVIKNSLINDQAGDTAVIIPQITAHLSPLHMLKGDIRVNTLIIGRPAIKLYRKSSHSPLNIQFLLDRLAGDEDDKKSPLPGIRINQIQIYEGRVTYDIEDEEQSTLFTPGHIDIRNIFCNLSLKKLNSDTLNLNIRSISGEESKGLTLERLSAKVNATNGNIRISDLLIRMPSSALAAKTITLTPQKSDIAINGEITADRISPCDFAPLLPTLAANTLPTLAANIKIGNKGGNTTGDISLSASDKSIILQIKAEANSLLHPEKSTISIKEGTLIPNATAHLQTIIGDSASNGFDILKRLGTIKINGSATNDEKTAKATIAIQSNCGNIDGNAVIDRQQHCSATLQMQNMHLGNILQNKDIGLCDIDAEIAGNIQGNNPDISFNSMIKSLIYKNYTYSPINIEGDYDSERLNAAISSSDPNACGRLTCSITQKERKELKFSAAIDSVKLDSLHIGKGDNGTISATADGTYNGYSDGKSLLDIRIYNIAQKRGKKRKNTRMVQIVDNNLLDNRSLIINSDFLDAKVAGQFTYESLIGTFKKIIHTHTPALSERNVPRYANNSYIFSLNIRNTSIISNLLGLPFIVSTNSSITGQCDDNRKLFIAKATLNNTEVKKHKFKTIEADIYANDSIAGIRSVLKTLPKTGSGITPPEFTTIKLNADAKNNHIATNLGWESTDTLSQRGNISLGVELAQTEGKTLFSALLRPGEIIYNGTKWALEKCKIQGYSDEVNIDRFHLDSDKKSLTVTGTLGKKSSDRLDVKLNKIELNNILDIVNFHSVEFGGITSGKVALNSIFDNPQFNCDLQIDSFSFEKGYMGELLFNAEWDEEQKAVNMRGDISDTNNAHTIIEGFVSPANDTLSLNINADKTRLSFLNSMLEGIISDVDATATGNILLAGPLGGLNLTGNAAVHGPMRVVATNATYTLQGDTVRMTPDRIFLDNLKIKDRYNNTGNINGNVFHKTLGHFTCNIDAEANSLLAYHCDNFYTEPFHGTVFATGKANITANDKGLFIHADVASNKNSSFVYDASEVASVSNSSFIKFVDKHKKHLPGNLEDEEEPTDTRRSLLSRLNLEFMIDVTPDIQLKVFTNRRTGDYIDLYGSGPISAVYDEKEGFSMNGQLDLERGTYRFTMQDIFLKEFDITKGSTLEFNGDPFDAQLNLKTKYLVPSASLSDLDPSGKRHKSVKVNCLMDITGKLEAPQLNFDIELPDASEEERELLASAVNTPEQKNTQFVYLLGIGKFYTYDYNRGDGNSQSSSAMESLISNTISGQLNNLLSQIIDNRNWNLSGNFSSSERGWNSMEVEGILEGRLLDNRLLINGNFGYRDNPLANSNFIGDFEVQWLLDRSGKVSLKAYNKTNDRYFSESSLNTQGAGIILRHDFNNWFRWLKSDKKREEKAETENK